jgi:UDP-N-acetyl-D-glucosamine dehydrogenase
VVLSVAHTPVADVLLERIRTRSAVVGVVGLGYVGLPLALRFAESGYRALGFDVDPAKVERIQRGESYIHHLKSDRIDAMRRKGLLEATGDMRRLAECDAILVCVPTPLTPQREPDLQYVEKTAIDIAAALRKGQLISLESTTYPGTTAEVVQPRLEEGGLVVGKDFFLCYSPEREDPGSRTHETKTIPKVVGGSTPACLELGVALYSAAVDEVVPVSSTQVAEATKILENVYRSVNIALVNELKTIFERMGIDVWDVIDAARTKPFGYQAFYPGPGLGGHCIPIDPFYLTWKAREYGVSTRFIELAGEINTAMPLRVVDRVVASLNDQGKPIRGARILLVGAAYKPDVDDVRESPALEIMHILQERGATVSYTDPYVRELHHGRRHKFTLKSAPLTEELARSVDAAIIVTDHAGVDYALLLKAPLVVDTRNVMARHGLSAPHVVKA